MIMNDEFNKEQELYGLNGTDRPIFTGNPAVVTSLMRNVYWWMTAALCITGLTSLFVNKSAGLLAMFYENPGFLIGLLVAELVLVLVLSARIEKMSFTTATVVFILYSMLNGLTFAPILLLYTKESVAGTFFICAGTFATMAVIGSFVKKDLSGMGRFLLMALIGLIIASVVNIFFGSSGLYFGITVVGVLLFAALTAYDAQKIKTILTLYGDEVNESTQKIALIGSLTLYLDFINLFLYMLRIFGKRN